MKAPWTVLLTLTAAALLVIELPCKAVARLANDPVPNLGQVMVKPGYGYRVGDRMTVEAYFDLPQNDNLTLVADEAELPEWLELVSSRHKRYGDTWKFVWVYQVFYVPDGQAVSLIIPPRTLRFRTSGGQTVELKIPELAFTLSPLTTPHQKTFEPDWQPGPPRWVWWPWGLAGIAGMLTGGWRLVARRRRPRIFGPLGNRLRKMRDPGPILLMVHRALDAKASRAVLTPQDLVDAWPAAGRAREALARFFGASHAFFYAGGLPGSDCKACALELCQALGKLEVSP